MMVKALMTSGCSEESIKNITEHSTTFFDAKYPERQKLDISWLSITGPKGSEVWKISNAGYDTACAAYKAFIDPLHSDWLKTAQPLLVLYYTIYYQNKAVFVEADLRIKTPEEIMHPDYGISMPD